MFNIFDPLNLRCLFQLRMCLSALKSHKKRHIFTDSPSEICLSGNGVEDTAHFILFCPIFANQRTHITAAVEETIGKHNLIVVN